MVESLAGGPLDPSFKLLLERNLPKERGKLRYLLNWLSIA